MVVHKRIQRIRKQSRIANPTENLWFFSEESAIRQSQMTEKQYMRTERLNSFDDHLKHSTSDMLKKQMNKKECSFVVDWQMSDTF
jgi:hypothetical protein